VQMVTGGISNSFTDAEQRESNYGRIIRANCRQRTNCLLRSLSIMLEDEGRYNTD
jgi:hypothetical protein